MLFDHLVGTGKQRSWNLDAKLLRGLEVDEQFKFGRLLNREVGGLGTSKDFVDVGGPTPDEVCNVRTIGHQST